MILTPELEERITAKMRSSAYQSPAEVVEASLDLLEEKDRFVETALGALPGQETRPIWETIAAIVAEVPPEAWDNVPTDLARNYRHYLYGARREEDKTSR